MNTGQLASYVIAAVSGIGALLAYFKFKPGQKESLVITAAEANLNIAKGTINLVTEEYESQFKRMSVDSRALRKDITELREELDLALEQARVLRREVGGLRAENTRLLAEVTDLRAENARLRGEPDG